MPRRFSIEYLDWLLAMPNCGGLAELYNTIYGWSGFSSSKPDYGLPEPLFVFYECQNWFAQGDYHELVPSSRQHAMLQALAHLAPPDFSQKYEIGMRDWQDESKIDSVDCWLRDNEDAANQWLLELITKYRALLEDITA